MMEDFLTMTDLTRGNVTEALLRDATREGGMTSKTVIVVGFGLHECGTCEANCTPPFEPGGSCKQGPDHMWPKNELRGMPASASGLERVQKGFAHFASVIAALPKPHRPRLLWMGIPAQGVLKPTEWVKQQGNEHIVKFNSAMRAFVKANYRSVFGSTSGTSDADGVVVDVSAPRDPPHTPRAHHKRLAHPSHLRRPTPDNPHTRRLNGIPSR
jgi:hypothetical protein